MDETGLIKLDNNSVTALQVFPNGVLTTGRRIQNKLLVLYDIGSVSDDTSSINFYGFGISPSTLRYQVPTTGNVHKFFCGTTEALTVGSSSSTFAGTIIAPAITLANVPLTTTLNDKASLSATAQQTFNGILSVPNLTVRTGGTLTTPAITLGSTPLATTLRDIASLSTTNAQTFDRYITDP